MTSFAERISKAMRTLGLTKEEVSKRLGCSRTMLYHYEKGENHPPKSILDGLRQLEHEAVIERNIYKEGEHISKVSDNPSHYKSSAERMHIGDSCRMVPVIGWAHAGEAENYDELPESWQDQVPTECKDEHAFAVRLEGNSMEPDFKDGDMLILQPTAEPYSGCLAVARLKDDGVIFRRFELRGDKVRLVPLNPQYGVEEFPRSDFKWIYPVWGSWRQIWR